MKKKICFVILVVFIVDCIRINYQVELFTFIRQFIIMFFLTIGLSLEMISGDFDLAFASQISVSAILGAFLIRSGNPIWLACILIFVFNALVGVIKSILLTRFKMPSIIFTLAIQAILLNLTPVFSETGIHFKSVYSYQGRSLLEVIYIILLIAAVIFTYVFLNKTYYGKYCRMLGENIELVEKSGLNSGIISLIIHGTASIFFSLVTIRIMLYTSSGSAYMGSHFLFRVLAAACLGGMGYSNGKGNISGMICGALTMVLMIIILTNNGMLNQSERIIEGVIILLSLSLGKKKKSDYTPPNSELSHIE